MQHIFWTEIEYSRINIDFYLSEEAKVCNRSGKLIVSLLQPIGERRTSRTAYSYKIEAHVQRDLETRVAQCRWPFFLSELTRNEWCARVHGTPIWKLRDTEYYATKALSMVVQKVQSPVL